jgi:hypothetical protein
MGGHISGSQVDPPGQIVDFAQLAIQMFAGDGPHSRADVLDLIGHWYRNSEMSDDDVRALLERYPPAAVRQTATQDAPGQQYLRYPSAPITREPQS